MNLEFQKVNLIILILFVNIYKSQLFVTNYISLHCFSYTFLLLLINLNFLHWNWIVIDNHFFLNSLLHFIIKMTYFFWNFRRGSFSKSLTSRPFPFSMTSGCLRHMSQPTWEKKKPLLALCGSAFVSLYLWWTLWSLDHSITWF